MACLHGRRRSRRGPVCSGRFSCAAQEPIIDRDSDSCRWRWMVRETRLARRGGRIVLERPCNPQHHHHCGHSCSAVAPFWCTLPRWRGSPPAGPSCGHRGSKARGSHRLLRCAPGRGHTPWRCAWRSRGAWPALRRPDVSSVQMVAPDAMRSTVNPWSAGASSVFVTFARTCLVALHTSHGNLARGTASGRARRTVRRVRIAHVRIGINGRAACRCAR